MITFNTFNLLPSILATLKENRLSQPTEIQVRAIPALLEGRSVVGVAETGSGKTLAYALPILHLMKSLENNNDKVTVAGRPRALVVVPSRDLGEQISKVFKTFTHATRLRLRTVLGGTTMAVAKQNIAAPFEVLVATPGRLVQIMEQGLLKLDDVRFIIFDEADLMLDQGFLNDATRIVRACPIDCPKALFSATLSPELQQLIASLFGKAEMIRSRGSHRVVASLTTTNRAIPDGKRFPVLEKILAKKVDGGTLIFTNTREQCDKVAEELKAQGHPCVIYRGEMDKVERRTNLKSFRDGKVDLLISTDLASRGLDVDHVGRVINYHLPQQIENYLHRVGRTARAGRAGLVINLVTERDTPLVRQLEKLELR